MNAFNVKIIKKKFITFCKKIASKTRIYSKKFIAFILKNKKDIFFGIFLAVILYRLFFAKVAFAFDSPFVRDFYLPLRKLYNETQMDLAAILMREMLKINKDFLLKDSKANSALFALALSKTFINQFDTALNSTF